MIDFATRVHNHNYRLDPIVRSLLDTDFYKLLMMQFIWRWFPDVPVTFSLINRTKTVRLAQMVPEAELREQLDYVRSLKFTNQELIWLQGNTFYGTRGMFEPAFIDVLRNLELPEYTLEVRDGQYEMTFSGPWVHVTLWEIYALSVVAELRARAAMRSLDKFELDILYAKAKTQAWDKVERLRKVDGLSLADFGTRRRHGYLWQEYVVQMLAEELGSSFTGTSNTHIAMKLGLEAIGTNAHELPMVLAAMADTDEDLKQSQYTVLDLWQKTYGGALLVMLPDTYGSTQFLRDAPDWVDSWTGIRIDSKDPVIAGEEAIAWWRSRGLDPTQKRILFSDGLTIDQIMHLQHHFHDRVRVGFGWGTNLTNDFRGCHPRGDSVIDPISLVCKISEAAGRPAVKLSDNYAKASGPPDLVEQYRAVFGTDGVDNLPVSV